MTDKEPLPPGVYEALIDQVRIVVNEGDRTALLIGMIVVHPEEYTGHRVVAELPNGYRKTEKEEVTDETNCT